MNKKRPVAPRIDLNKRRVAIESFERLGQKLITQLRFETFFACTQRMPHFNEVQELCESAFVQEITMQATINQQRDFCDRLGAGTAGTDPVLKAMMKRVRSRYRKVDRWLDNWILVCWIHCGLWLFTNEDRMRLMSVWLRDRAKFPALSSTDAFRKRCKRLGVPGWNDFQSTYLDAPLHYNPGADSSVQVFAARLWKDVFLPIRA